MKSAKGLHLWSAKFGYTTLFVTTRFRSPQEAVKKAQQAAKDQGVISLLDRLEHNGTIDA